jgi:transposase
MGMAELVVAAVVFEGRSKSAVAREYGISRRWVITLVQRYLDEGDAGLAPRSRRPRRSPDQTPAKIEDEIIAIRKRLDRAGQEAGAATIAAHLERRHGHSPAVSTIWRTPDRPWLCHTPAPQAAQELLHPLRSSHAQRAVADRHHPLSPCRRNRRRDPQHRR